MCMATWQEQVEKFFDDAVAELKKNASLKAGADKVNRAMAWKLVPTPISPDMRQLVENQSAGSIVSVYLRLFDELNLYLSSKEQPYRG